MTFVVLLMLFLCVLLIIELEESSSRRIEAYRKYMVYKLVLYSFVAVYVILLFVGRVSRTTNQTLKGKQHVLTLFVNKFMFYLF